MSITVESVQTLLKSDNFGDRMRGVNQLRELDRSVAYEMIVPLLTDQNVRVRYAAMSQMSTLGTEDPKRTLEYLRIGMRDPEADVKAAAADCVGALHLVEAYPDLRALYIDTSDWIIQMSIVATLGELGEPEAIEILESAINSGTELLVLSAIGALGELRDDRAIALLQPLAQNDDSQIRYRVAQALAYFPNSGDAKAILSTMTRDLEPMVSDYAKELLKSA
jgi:HEAT repeat protein